MQILPGRQIYCIWGG